jgi:hypothetical protein
MMANDNAYALLFAISSPSDAGALLLPGDRTTQITKVSPTSASAKIACCGTNALEVDFTGIIRHQDVRAHEIDKVRQHWDPSLTGYGQPSLSHA